MFKPVLIEGVRFLRDETGRLVVPLFGAKGDVNIPPPSAEETALKKKQLELILQQQGVAKQQQQEQEALAPYLYQQMGLKKVSTADPKIAGLEQELARLQGMPAAAPAQPTRTWNPTKRMWMTNPAAVDPAIAQRQSRMKAINKQLTTLRANPTTSFQALSEAEKRALMSPEEQQTADIQSLANQRTKKALEGNLDVDPSVEADISRGEGQLRAELLRKLGPGAEGSDSWNRAMSEYSRNMNAVRYSVRHGEMTTADALATNRSTEQMRRQDQALRNLKGATDPYSVNANTLSGVGNNIGGAINQYYGERVNAADLSMQGSNIRNAFWGNIIGAGLGAGGMAMGMRR